LKKLSKLLINLFLLFLFSFVFAQEDASFDVKIKENEKKLGSIRSQLTQIKTKKDSLNIQETKALLYLNRMDEEIYLTDLLLKQLNERDVLLTKRIDTLTVEISRKESELSKRKEVLKERVGDIYKKGKVHTFELVFTSKSFADLAQRMRFLTILAKQDKRLYDRIKKIQIQLSKNIDEMNTNREQLKKVRFEAENEKISLTNETMNKKAFIKQIAAERQKQNKLEDELKRSEESLQYLINKLRVAQRNVEKKRDVKDGTHYFDTHKGKLSWPAKGTVVSNFGTVRHPKYQTKTMNNGIDIKINIGDPVYSIYDGDVIYADKFLGYGNVIMIDHGNGYYTLYAHLSEINVILNQPILSGEIIGKGGDTGSLSGPILHFEIRKDGKPLNPTLYLKR